MRVNLFGFLLACLIVATFLTACKSTPELSDDNKLATQVAFQQTIDASVKMTVDAQNQPADPADNPNSDGDDQPSQTPSPTLEPTPTDTLEPSATATLDEKAVISVDVDTNCRLGPGKPYDIVGGLLVGEEAQIVGVPEIQMEYVIIKNPDAAGDCWLWTKYAKIDGNLSSLPKIFIPPTPTPEPGSIAGIVWDDKCSQFDAGDPPPGCIAPENAGDPYPANGTLDSGETGFAGVIVQLGLGACPSVGLATTTTASDGTYAFNDLTPGKYCVTINALDPTNAAILIPGGWSYPRNSGAQTVDVGSGEDKTGISFGWDFQLD